MLFPSLLLASVVPPVSIRYPRSQFHGDRLNRENMRHGDQLSLSYTILQELALTTSHPLFSILSVSIVKCPTNQWHASKRIPQIKCVFQHKTHPAFGMNSNVRWCFQTWCLTYARACVKEQCSQTLVSGSAFCRNQLSLHQALYQTCCRHWAQVHLVSFTLPCGHRT